MIAYFGTASFGSPCLCGELGVFQKDYRLTRGTALSSALVYSCRGASNT